MINLLVIYTNQLDACRDWYTTLGLDFSREQHGTSPSHVAATAADGTVIELYPADSTPPTGQLRIGLNLPATDTYQAGTHVLTDPDGRTIVLTAGTRYAICPACGTRRAINSKGIFRYHRLARDPETSRWETPDYCDGSGQRPGTDPSTWKIRPKWQPRPRNGESYDQT